MLSSIAALANNWTMVLIGFPLAFSDSQFEENQPIVISSYLTAACTFFQNKRWKLDNIHSPAHGCITQPPCVAPSGDCEKVIS